MFDRELDHIRAFNIKQMLYKVNVCSICHESRIERKMTSDTVCQRCKNDKMQVKMFSSENNMNPQPVPNELRDLSEVEQQLICRISPCINIQFLKHGGISANGHCVTFPQEINEPTNIFPRLPTEVSLFKVQKRGKNDSSKDFRVLAYKKFW